MRIIIAFLIKRDYELNRLIALLLLVMPAVACNRRYNHPC